MAQELHCSFCGKSQRQVAKLIAGPGVYICDECVDLCAEIIEDDLGRDWRQPGVTVKPEVQLPAPKRKTD